MPEAQKRQTAIKARISEIISGSYVKEEGWTPNFILTESGKKISRANIMGAVIDKADTPDEFLSFTIQDGTGTMPVRSFEDDARIKSLDAGDVVLVIGKPREYGSEKYIVPEIIRVIENKKWVDVRKAELEIEELRQKGEGNFYYKEEKKETPSQGQAEEEDIESEKPSGAGSVYETIRELDKGKGADIEDVIKKSKAENAEQIIKKLLMEGEVFEISPGRLKVLE